MNQFITFLEAEKTKSAGVVDSFLSQKRQDYAHIEPLLDEMLSLLHDYSLLDGKWHRPALAVLAYQMAGGSLDKPVHQAAAPLELLHRYILIHDDIIDRDLERHGGPTLEKSYLNKAETKFGSHPEMYAKGMAMVAGDILNTLAYQMVLESGFPEDVILGVLSSYNRLFVETAAGWQLQTNQNYLPIESVSETDFIRGMELVSARYSFIWPLRIGQILAGKNETQWNQELDAYGYHTGIAFQIQDDILGLFGSREKTGKPVGHDYREGKKTLLILKAYENANPADKEFITSTLGQPLEEGTLEKIQSIVETGGSLAYSRNLAADHGQKAQAIVAGWPEHPTKIILHELAEFVAKRAS